MKRALLVLLLLATPALADIVHLKNGGRIEGRVADLGDRYSIETDAGTITIRKEDVLRVEKKEYVPREREKLAGERKGPGLSVRLPVPFAHPFLAFKIRLPAGWKRGGKAAQARCSFYGPADVAYIPRIDLFIERNNDDLMDFTGRYRDAYRKEFPDATFPRQEVITIHGRTAFQLHALYSEDLLVRKSLWTFLGAGDRKFILAFHCTEAWFGRYERIVNAAMQTLRAFPERTESREKMKEYTRHYDAGQRSYDRGGYEEALREFRSAAACLPKWPDIHCCVGTACMKLGKHEEAEKAFREGIVLDPDDVDLQYNMGLCLLKLSKAREAAAALRDAIALEPGFEPACTNLGSALIELCQYEEARTILERAVELDPESAPAHYNLGLAYEHLGLKDKAARQFQDTLSLDPEHGGAKEALERVKE